MFGIIITLLILNIVSFLIFVFRHALDESFLSGVNGISDELAIALALCGAFGAYFGMKKCKKGIDDDIVFKITIPVSMVIQTAVLIYLLLFDLGLVS